MSAAVPAGPVHAAPREFVPEHVRAEVLARTLAGIELGEYDQRVAAWLAGWDAATVLTVASWVARARMAGPAR